MIRFVVKSVPIPQPRQRHRIAQDSIGNAFTRNYTDGKHPVLGFKYDVRKAADDAYKGMGPIQGPVSLHISFVMPRPKSMVWSKKEMPRVHHDKKPDVDNLAKAVMDALKGIIWRDDSQVCVCHLYKWIAAGDEIPHVVIEVKEIDQ